VVVDAGHDPRLADLARRGIDQPRTEQDVQLPQLHRRRPLPAHVVRALTPATTARDEAVTDEDAVIVERDGNGSGDAGKRISSCRIRNAPHFGCSRRISQMTASTAAGAWCGHDRGRRERSASPAKPASR
jgi:hypothetical protein